MLVVVVTFGRIERHEEVSVYIAFIRLMTKQKKMLLKQEKRLSLAPNNWKYYCIDDVLKSERKDGTEKYVDRNLDELDIYYLLKVLLDDRNWKVLKDLFPENDFYSDKNKRLLLDVKEIRNTVMHPRIEVYDESDFNDWTEKIKETAKLFGSELGQLLADLHKSEKDRLFAFICERTFDITMNSPDFVKLPRHKQESIARTKQRLQDQTTAAGIMALFEDSYFLKKGQPIKEGLEEFHLPTFEDVMDDVRDFYYFGKVKGVSPAPSHLHSHHNRHVI